jgi:hypothetical protein
MSDHSPHHAGHRGSLANPKLQIKAAHAAATYNLLSAALNCLLLASPSRLLSPLLLPHHDLGSPIGAILVFLCNAGSPQTALTPALIHTPDTNCSFSHYTPKSTNRNHTWRFSRLPHASNDQI